MPGWAAVGRGNVGQHLLNLSSKCKNAKPIGLAFLDCNKMNTYLELGTVDYFRGQDAELFADLLKLRAEFWITQVVVDFPAVLGPVRIV